MSSVPQALTDKDFLTAQPTDQKKYLASIDSDFAKASPADQDAYHQHVVMPAVRTNSLKMNAQPTQFEQAHAPTKDSGFLSHVGQSIRSMLPEPPKSFGEAVTSGLGASTGALMPIVNAGKEMVAAHGRGHGLPYSAAAGLSTIAGVSPERMESAAERGDTGGVLGEAAVPSAMAAGGYLTHVAKPALARGLSAVKPELLDYAHAIQHPTEIPGRIAKAAVEKIPDTPEVAAAKQKEMEEGQAAEINKATKMQDAYNKRAAREAS